MMSALRFAAVVILLVWLGVCIAWDSLLDAIRPAGYLSGNSTK